MASKMFMVRLEREIRLFLRELRDGCVDCIEAGDYCDAHQKVAVDVTINPRKYIRISLPTAESPKAESHRA